MNQDKINLYDAQMAMNLPSAVQITAFVFNGFAGIQLPITKNDVHGACEFGIANWKKDIEMCDRLTTQQKEEKKMKCEAVFRGIETMLLDSLKCHQQLS